MIKKTPTSTANRAVIYVRVSTKDQVDNFSLATQEARCRSYCKQHNFDVDKVFIEKGESAKTTDRTELQNMLTFCREKKGRVQWVVVYDVKRFARDTHDHLVMRAYLGSLGVNLRSATESFDESSTGKFLESMMAAVAQLDNDTRKDRTVDGMKKAIQSGQWCFKSPPGYLNNDGTQGSGSLIHDPERAPLVQQAFELYATGLYTRPQVLEKVTAAGLNTAGSGTPFKRQTFEKMLRNPIYAGWIVVEKWGDPVRGDFEPLITQELFDQVQAILHGKRATLAPRLRSHPDFPLRHFCEVRGVQPSADSELVEGQDEEVSILRVSQWEVPGRQHPQG